MRILHLDPDDVANPVSGGGPVRTLEIYKRLARRHEITVLTPTFPGSTPELIRDGIRYIRLGRKIGNHGSSHHLTFLASLPAAVRRYDYDLLVEDMMPPCSTTWTPWFARRSKPLIASVQWWMADMYTERLKLPFHWGQLYGVRWYRHFMVLTEQMRQTIVSRNPLADCRVIPNGVDQTLFDLPYSQDGRLGRDILYLGRIDIKTKGLDLLLAALARIDPSSRPRLVVAGYGPPDRQSQFEQLIDTYGLRGGITQVGQVGQLERSQLIRDCRFMVMPSRFETFGMTIAEANAAGKIALTFDTWPMNEVSAPVSPRVKAYDVDGFAAAITRLMQMPDGLLMALGDQCRQWARRYNWDDVASAQEAFYLDVVSRHPQCSNQWAAG